MHRIEFTPEALGHIKAMPRHVKVEVFDMIESVLTRQPARESKSRIKRLRDLPWPEYRLRFGEWRVFYVLPESDLVLVVAVLNKSTSVTWLEHLRDQSPPSES